MSSSAITFGQSTVLSSNIVWSEPVAFRNKIINGSFDVWQRGTSSNNALGAASYASDRWRCGSTGATSSFSISTDVPLGFRSSINCSDGGSSFGFIQQRIETVNSYSLVNKTITLSFWVKTNTPSDVRAVLSFANALNDFTTVTDITTRNVSSQVTSGAWSFVTTSFTVPAGASNGLQIALYFNWGTAGGKSALFTGIQLEEGTIATPFEHRPIGTELALCQRYFQTVDTGGLGGVFSRTFNYSAGTLVVPINVSFKTTMRTTPHTVTGIYDINDGANQNLPAVTANPDGFTVNSISVPAGQFIDLQSYRASAEL